jgi:MYXO-CTERM domain-containing protein
MRHLPLVLSLLLAVPGLLVAAPGLAFDDAFKIIEGGAFNPEAGPIHYALEPNGSADVDGDADLEALRASFRAWACVEGTSVRFEEDEEPGVANIDDSDGKNSLFWDESGDECGMGPGTLGITVGGVGGTFRDQADICFNGRDSEWGVAAATDIESIAMHEIGHMIGLDHPCDSDADPDSCLSPDEAVMFPSWSGKNEREPLSSDVAGVVSLYPLIDESGCEGPFSEGEKCACNDECVEGLLCVPDAKQQLRCGRACTSTDRDCGAGATCVLDVPQDGGDAPGICVTVVADKPAGAVCSQGPECESGTCVAVIALGSSICLVTCDNDDDCAGGSCFDGRCLGGFESEECPVLEPPDDCACTTSGKQTSSSPLSGAVALALAAGLALRRRRSLPGLPPDG